VAGDRGGVGLTASFAAPTLRLSEEQYRRVVGHCYDGLPYEACGLLAGPMLAGEPTGLVTAVYPAHNADASARTYTVDSKDLLRSMRDAESRGEELIGVWHSHTHTDAYPSETDVRQAPDPAWLYVLVSLRDGAPQVRAYRIRAGEIAEIPVALESRP
jgi:[CysO sulfur-carrier protein]-S-L-cysteine hydrolase